MTAALRKSSTSRRVDTAPAALEDDTYLLAISDGTLTPFRSPLDGWSYRFSPDGSQVAFTALDASGEQQIYRMEADGAGMTELTGSGFTSEWAVDVDEPAWSPDGEWLVISGTDVHSGRRSLYFLSPRRHPQTRDHAPPRSGIGYIQQASEPIWSPDGRDIAFTATGDDGPQDPARPNDQVLRREEHHHHRPPEGFPRGSLVVLLVNGRHPGRLRSRRLTTREHR